MAEKKLGTLTVKVDKPLATDALLLKFRLFKIVGGAVDRLPAILAGLGDSKSAEEKEASNAAAVAAFADMIAKVEPLEAVQLIKDIVEMAQVKTASGEYETADLDQDFSGDLGAALKVVIFVLTETFGDFFVGALATIGLTRRAKRSATEKSAA